MNISEEQITAGAAWLARNVFKTLWGGLRSDGRASDAGFDPWYRSDYGIGNARQEDYRDAVRTMLAEMGIIQQIKQS